MSECEQDRTSSSTGEPRRQRACLRFCPPQGLHDACAFLCTYLQPPGASVHMLCNMHVCNTRAHQAPVVQASRLMAFTSTRLRASRGASPQSACSMLQSPKDGGMCPHCHSQEPACWPQVKPRYRLTCAASQSATDAGVVECDAALGGVLGEPRARLSSMEQRLAALLAPAPPHVLQYTVWCVPHVCASARARVCVCVCVCVPHALRLVVHAESLVWLMRSAIPFVSGPQ